METWLNDMSEDGFLYNLREPEKFIKMDSMWNATITEETSKPAETTMVEDAVGLLNLYEYTMSYSGTDARNGYLNNEHYWWLLTPVSTPWVWQVRYNGTINDADVTNAVGIRPAVNLKPDVRIVAGDGTENNPYRLEGDNDSNLNGTLLNTRYSGEYIRFGTGENTLYRIVSHETPGLTKITSAGPLMNGEEFIESEFGSTVNYSSDNTIGVFLNGQYLTDHVGDSYSNMIEPNTTWYLGTVGRGVSYRSAKYSSTTGNTLTSNITTASVGLLRHGELMAGKFDQISRAASRYWTITPYNGVGKAYINEYAFEGSTAPTASNSVKPAMNLKSNVVITGGSGTKSDPFTLSLS